MVPDMPQYREHCRWAEMDSDEQAFFADVPFSSHPSSRSPSRSPVRPSSSRMYTPPRAVTSPFESSSEFCNQRHRRSLFDNEYSVSPYPENIRRRQPSARQPSTLQQHYKPCRPRGGDYTPSPRFYAPQSRGLVAASQISLPTSPPPRSSLKMVTNRYPPLEEWNPPLPNPYFTESQRQPHPLQKKHKGVRSEEARAELHYRLGDVRRRLCFDEEEEEDELVVSPREGPLQAGASAPSCISTALRRGRRGRGYSSLLADADPNIVTMTTDVTLSTAQARRRFAPSWAFIAWEMDPDFLDECVDYYFRNKRWLEPSKLPAWLRRACRLNDQPLTQLYANEPFAPVYMFILKDMDDEWFRWAIDYFFAEGCWPEFERFPAFLHRECKSMGIGPDNYYNI